VADFFPEDLQDSRFERVDLSGAQFRTVDLSGATFRGVYRKVSTRGPAERLDQESLDSHTEPVDGPGWPESRSYPVRECLLIILNEAWGVAHLRGVRGPRCWECRSAD
jgi:hypothetical protein